MPPPTPIECSVEECDFKTAVGAPSWDVMLQLLTNHTQAVHGGGGQGQPILATGHSKLEKLPRPTFSLNMTESQWTFKKLQWDNYISQSVVSPAVQLMQKYKLHVTTDSGRGFSILAPMPHSPLWNSSFRR